MKNLILLKSINEEATKKGREMFKNGILVFATLILTVGCVKDRPKIDQQGSNLDNLIEIKEVKSWDHSVKTSDTENLGETTLARNLNVSNIENIKFPNVVSITSDAPLLKGSIEDIDYFGMPNTEYEVKYVFGPNLLKIYKVIPNSDLSHYEKPYAKAFEGKWLIPIGGYEVKYFTVELIRNSDNEDSNERKKYSVPPEQYKRATHIELKRNDFKSFERVEKQDVLPSDYFTSTEWYYSSAIISTKPEEQTGIGYVDGTTDASLKRATLVRFSKTEEQLRATNAVRDERANISEDQADIVFNIPVNWFDSRIKPEGSTESLEEEMIPNLRYNEEPWGEFDFRNIVALKKGGSSRVQKFFEGIVLDSLTLKEDSFSFTLLYLGSGEKEKFSFLRYTDRDYKEKIYYKDDRRVFGTFAVEKFRLANLDEHREEDAEKNVFVQRFNPKKEIVFRFSDMTPKFDPSKESFVDENFSMDYRELGRNCTKYWNRAFELAGTNTKVTLDESRDAELGDFDSNILNIIPILSNGGGGGVGPSVADPLTGETIAATANLFVTNGVIRGRADKVRDFIRVQSGRVSNVNLLDPEGKGIPILNQISKDVRKFCPEVVRFADDLKRKGSGFRVSTLEENKVVIPCVERLMKPRLQGILCHEMGHNLGLRHNFYCSADEKNMALTYDKVEKLYPRKDFPEIYEEFYPEESFLPEMTCVMDYADFDEFNMPAMPMAYDIAALSYIYSEKLFTEFDLGNGNLKLEDYNPGLPLDEQDVYQASNKFKYCTDEDSVQRARTAGAIPIDPMCALWDNGKSPKEKMRHLFRSLRETVILNSVKFDRTSAYSDGGLDAFYSRTIENMASIYGTWRSYLVGKVGHDNKYLSNFNNEQYNNFIENLKNDEDFIGAEYIGASEVFYENLAEILYMPQYFCIAIDANENIQLYEFRSLQREIVSSSNDYVIEGCSDAKVAAYFENELNLTYVDEVGSPTDSIKFSLDPYDSRETVDMIGTSHLRRSASRFLTTRIPYLTYPMAVNEILPSVLDEPALYEKFVTDFEQRVLVGASPGIGFKNKLKSNDIIAADSFVLKPAGPIWPILDNAMRFLLLGNPQKGVYPAMLLPYEGGSEYSTNRQEFLINKQSTKNLIDENRVYYSNQGVYYQPVEDNGFAVNLIEKIKDLEDEISRRSAISGLSPEQNSYIEKRKLTDLRDHRAGLLNLLSSL